MANQLPPTEASLPIALIRAREAIMGPVREMLAQSGLTEQQWRVLRVLEEGGPTDARALADGAAILAPSLSRILPGLEDRGLILRTGDPRDRRRQVIEISRSGLDLVDANRAQAHDLAAEARARLGSDRYDQLLELLGEVSRWRDGR